MAGTYLAASTFYVALTGQPVPPASEVPPGLSAQDAAHLRAISQAGTDCAGVQVKGAIQASFGADTDGGAPLDWGTAGLPIAMEFQLMNRGEATVGITDGMSLAPPFIWTTGGAYPGGADAGFCGSSLAAGETCTLSITFTGESSATGRLTLGYSGAYTPGATRTLRGTATTRALLSVSESPGFLVCTDALCGPVQFNAFPGTVAPFSLIVLNRGALPVTAMGEGAPLSPPFAWAAGSFPDSSSDAGTAYPNCSAGPLGVGEQCALSLTFSAADAGTYTGAVSVEYSDALGPVTPDASRTVEGDCTTTRLPP